MAAITLEKVNGLLAQEVERFVGERPKSRRLFEQAKKNLVGGVPMSWMRIWTGGFPVFVDKAEGVFITDVDGHRYLDLCLGDTGGLCGHAHPKIVEAITKQMKDRGTTTMLPTEDCVWVGGELERRFGLPYWQVLMTATDANRMALKVARSFTGRQLVLCFNGTYHGSVDETLVVNFFGEIVNIPGMLGPIVPDATQMTRVIDFNDAEALEKALAPGDIACVITEPVMTNLGIIPPEPGYHDALRTITKKYGTLLLIDETHSMCAGPRGITGELSLKPDIFVAGKFVAGGYPAAVLGFTREISDWMAAREPWHNFFGFGGTLSGNATAVAGIRAAFEHVINDENFSRMIVLAERMEKGLADIIRRNGLAWYVARIGCRVEFRFLPRPPKNGSEAMFAEVGYNAVDIVTEGLTGPLDALIHVWCANRGVLLTPVHEMALVGPTATKQDVDHYVSVIADLVDTLLK
ncbi:MAG: transaminase [Desulfomonilia bacterium]|nr:transaminase [Deltaproteobacteria bacterium]MDX9762041.1 transaminase [Desulfomonilia bacterium]HPW68535.1 transaminase [Deltaproteobacteria bacterium]